MEEDWPLFLTTDALYWLIKELAQNKKKALKRQHPPREVKAASFPSLPDLNKMADNSIHCTTPSHKLHPSFSRDLVFFLSVYPPLHKANPRSSHNVHRTTTVLYPKQLCQMKCTLDVMLILLCVKIKGKKHYGTWFLWSPCVFTAQHWLDEGMEGVTKWCLCYCIMLCVWMWSERKRGWRSEREIERENETATERNRVWERERLWLGEHEIHSRNVSSVYLLEMADWQLM